MREADYPPQPQFGSTRAPIDARFFLLGCNDRYPPPIYLILLLVDDHRFSGERIAHSLTKYKRAVIEQ